MFKSIYNWIKSVILWLLVKKNRELGIKYTKKGLDLFSFVAEKTKNKKDDIIALHMIEQFNKALPLTQPDTIEQIKKIEKITKEVSNISKGSLKDVKLSLKDGKINTSVGPFGASYNPSNGQVKFNIQY